MTQQLSLSAKVLLCFLLIHRKVGHFSPLASLSKPKLRYFRLVCQLRQTRTQMFLLRSWRPERVKGAEGRQEVVRRFSSENPFGDFQSLLFHARQRRTGDVLGSHRPGQAALLQHKVVVGSGVHGVENVGVVRDPELFVLRDFLHQLVLFGLLSLQVVFDHCLPDDGWSLVLTRHQDALVHVSVLHVQADPDDAAVVHLLVVQRQRQSRVVRHRRHRAFV